MKPTSVTDPNGTRSQPPRQETSAERLLRLEVADVEWQMGSQEGRRNVWRLLQRIGGAATLLDYDFDPNAISMAHKFGKRGVLSRLVWLVREHCLPQWNLMFLENQEQKQ